jgi:two-component system chemotaxis response regulator CheY
MRTNTVLIADDALFMRTLLRDIFLEFGWQVIAEAEDGEQALAAYTEQRPDLVTMDVVMPGMGGVAALEKILAQDASARIVVCSALGQKQLMLKAIKAGARDFIVKPFRKDQVREVIDRVMAG